MDPSPCLCANDIARWLDDGIALPAGFERHLDGCERCRDVIAEVVKLHSVEGEVDDASPRDAADDWRGFGHTVGRFALIELIGQGGMGTVYAAHDPQLQRCVALKLVHARSRNRDAAAGARLRREAMAMARLAHPNIVHVYEIGGHDGEVFVAMELIRGQTLAQWSAAQRRSLAEIVEVFAAIARGLAAAHHIGLVHRDVKPANVLIDERGHVRVSDFGLAKLVEETGADAPEDVVEVDGDRTASSWVRTKVGAVVGTPAYMAPEQLKGGSMGPLGDQFSFFVMLYEALFGRRPFEPTDSVEATLARIDRGPIVPATATGRGWLPLRLRRGLVRGLRAEPADRHADMDRVCELLEASRPRKSRRVAVLAAAATASIALVASYAVRAPSACERSAAAFEQAWADPRRDSIARAFEATGLPYWRSAWTAVAASVETQAARWDRVHTELCTSSSRRHDVLEEPHLRCLADKLTEFEAYLEAMERADRAVLDHAARAVSSWQLDACADADSLASIAPLQPELGAIAELDAVRSELAQARAALELGRRAEAQKRAIELEQRPLASDYRPVQAEISLLRARAHEAIGEHASAREQAWQAIVAAHAGRHDRVLVGAYAALAAIEGGSPAVRYVELARAVLERIDGGDELRAQVDLAEAQWLARDGQLDRAAELLGRIVDADAETGLTVAVTAEALSRRAGVLSAQGRYTEAAASAEAAAMAVERVYGPAHPAVASALAELTLAEGDAGRLVEAQLAAERALAIREALVEVDPALVARSLNDLGFVQVYRRRYDAARELFERSLALLERSETRDEGAYGVTADNLGLAHSGLGDLDKAEEFHGRAIAALTRALGSEHYQVGLVLMNLGEVELRRGRHAEALATFSRGLSINRSARGLGHPQNAIFLFAIGKAHLKLGDAAAAIEALEEALSLRGSVPDDRSTVAHISYALGIALWKGARERGRARELIVAARDTFAELGAGFEHDRDRARQWLATHGGPVHDGPSADGGGPT